MVYLKNSDFSAYGTHSIKFAAVNDVSAFLISFGLCCSVIADCGSQGSVPLFIDLISAFCATAVSPLSRNLHVQCSWCTFFSCCFTAYDQDQIFWSCCSERSTSQFTIATNDPMDSIRFKIAPDLATHTLMIELNGSFVSPMKSLFLLFFKWGLQ